MTVIQASSRTTDVNVIGVSGTLCTVWKNLWRKRVGNVDDTATSPVVHLASPPRVALGRGRPQPDSPRALDYRWISPVSTAVMTTDVLDLLIRENNKNTNCPETGDKHRTSVMEEA